MFNFASNWDEASNGSVIIIGVGEGEQRLPDQLLNASGDWIKPIQNKHESGGIRSKSGELTSFTIPFNETFKTLIFVGKGSSKEQDIIATKEALGSGFQAAHKLKEAHIDVLLDTFIDHTSDTETVISAAAEMAHTATYTFEAYKTNKHDTLARTYTFYCAEQHDEAINVGTAIAKGVNFARTLVNIPANDLTPVALAGEARALSSRHDHLSFEVLGNEELEEMGMHALLAVNQGSDQPAQMIVLRYQGLENWDEPLTFVGKGLTYDTGGYSMKPPEGMKTMKSDMGGAAAVLGAMEIIAETKPAINVMAVIPSTENMVNGKAMRPGDVLGSFDGQTIEVTNTDAEGRLVLADGVSYAKHLGAKKIVDVATLTGACVVALGDVITGAVSNDDDFYNRTATAAIESGEDIWRFPTHPRYYKMLRQSDVADLNNAPGRLAGSITAGLFIESFVKDTPWVHLDIAGTSFLDRVTPMGPKGGTGVMARTLATLANHESRS
ncbi:leucyl aminopeptidase [Geomicrobium sediminis]|uniref:Probable cytosol aminopeptidase n=1 Tax=Geomicrobium sediminis TaxID=1347788 RepID=A0ABS2P9J3_9BACL|nr:leucyl aminopeptidase [Geomicrobium sediminis]MBM7631979.1 leucyl aminopeptidase [Geomicrobium sediminis]